MSCMTIVMQPTMATTRLALSLCFVDSAAENTEWIVERPQLSMSWVVVTDENGKRQLRMRWNTGQTS
jgi:hypothetical protein